MRLAWCVAVLALPATAIAESENYEQIRVDAGMTGSSVSVSDRNGVGTVVEIKANALDHLAIGGRVEIAVMFGGRVGDDRAAMDVAIAASGLVKGEWFFGDGPLRPFVGLGVGGYTIGSQTVASGPNRTGIDQQTGRYFGVAPQIGIDLGRLRLAATYNAILGATLEVHQTVGTIEHVEHLSQNYLSLEVSFRFGGGRKSRPVSPPPPPMIYGPPAPPPPWAPIGPPGVPPGPPPQ